MHFSERRENIENIIEGNLPTWIKFNRMNDGKILLKVDETNGKLDEWCLFEGFMDNMNWLNNTHFISKYSFNSIAFFFFFLSSFDSFALLLFLFFHFQASCFLFLFKRPAVIDPLLSAPFLYPLPLRFPLLCLLGALSFITHIIHSISRI